MLNMNYIQVLRIETDFKGYAMCKDPYIPDSAASIEDQVTPRIPVGMDILGCLRSLEFSTRFYGETKNDDLNKYCRPIIVYLYKAFVCPQDLYVPSIEHVPDVWYTNERWLLKPTLFNLQETAVVRKHMEIPNSPYSRYAYTVQGYDEVVDRRLATPIYGDRTAFSYIDIDPTRRGKDCEEINEDIKI